MDGQKLKDIQPPKKDGELTEKQKRRNTYIFTVIMSLFNLVFTIVIVFGLILLSSMIVRSVSPDMNQETFSKFVKTIMWISVIIGISCSFIFQNLLVKIIIKGFKLENKLEKIFVDKYCKKKEKN